jgi:hypothetical protein
MSIFQWMQFEDQVPLFCNSAAYADENPPISMAKSFTQWRGCCEKISVKWEIIIF